jgi:inner membrane protein
LPTPFTHALIPLALGHTVTDKKLPLRFWILAVFCSVLPDLDVIGFRFGISYGDFFGHRGFFHSLFFAFLLSSAVMLVAFRKPPVFSKKWWLMWLFLFGVSSSHGMLDAFTDGGLGIALLSPFDNLRYFSPWRPIAVSPIGIRAFFTYWRKEVLLTELYWVWLPLALAFIIVKAYRRIKLMKCDKTRKTISKSVELGKNIAKWLFVVWLVMALILGCILQAPWKLMTLFLIFLVACTVLPKPYRKWSWYSVAAVVLGLIIWNFLPEDSEGWRPYTFDDELAALQAKYAIPDSENAATIYNQLLEDFNDVDFYNNLPTEVRINFPIREPWSEQDNPELAQWLRKKQTTIEKLIETSKIDKCQFPIADTIELGKKTNRFTLMRQWTFFLITVAANDLGEDRIDEALEKYMVVLQIGKHHYQQPSGIEKLLGIAIEALAVSQFNRFIVTGAATEEHLSIIEEAVADIKHDWSSDLPGLLEHEKLMTKNIVCGMVYRVNSEGRTRLSRDPQVAIRSVLPGEFPKLTFGQINFINACTVWGWFVVPSTPQKAGEIIDGIYEEFYSMAEPDFDWEKEPKEISPWSIKLNFGFFAKSMVSLLKGDYYRIHDLYLRADSNKKATLLIIALRRYKNETGQWPQKLDDVKSLAPAEIFVDSINGNSFVYKLTEDNFTLYSTGKNNIDDGGERTGKVGADDWLIWPRPIYKPSPSPPHPPPPPPPPPPP